MKNVWVKVMSVLVGAAVLTYLGIRAYNGFYSPYKTETVYENTATDSIEVKGVAFRNEQVLDQKATDEAVISYYYPNGSKVAKGEQVARIYAQAEDLKLNYQIEQLDQEIAALKDCKAGTVGGAQTESINNNLNEKQMRLIRLIDDHDLVDLADTKYSILKELNKKQLLIGKIKNVDSRIKTLTAQRNKLKNRVSGNYQSVTAAASGFFVDETDGYEQLAAYSAGKKPTLQALEDLLDGKGVKKSNAIGKIITGYDWRFVIRVRNEDLMKFTEGRSVSVTFSSFADYEVDVEIERVITNEKGKESVVVLKCDLMDENIAALRVDTAKINFKTNRGLKVSKKALYIQDGEKGVYCMLGNELIFKKVDILFETEDYFLSQQHPEDSSYLKIYDDVVVKGKDLYDKQRAE